MEALWLNTGLISDFDRVLRLSFRAAKMPLWLRVGLGIKPGWVGDELPEGVLKISCSDSSNGGVGEGDCDLNVPRSLSEEGRLLW